MIIENETPSKKTITLRLVSPHDLTVTYARDMGNNKYRHYKVSLAITAVAKINPRDAIQEHIEAEEGKDITFVFISTPPPSSDFKIVDAISILDDFPALKKPFLGKGSGTVLMQIVPPMSLKERFLIPFYRFYNKFVGIFNWFSWKLYNIINTAPLNTDWFETPKHFHLNFKFDKTRRTINRLEPCRYLTVAYEEQDAAQAVKALVDDINVLVSQDLILGYLLRPSLMKLHDSVGTGKNTYSLCCFVFVDSDKIYKLLNTEYHRDEKLLNAVGCKYESNESGTGWLDGSNPHTKYQIEEIYVLKANTDEQKDSMFEAYEIQQQVIEAAFQKRLENALLRDRHGLPSSGAV